jgi:serine/threonine protein kinase
MPPYLNAVIGDYQVTGYLGEGGMGQVYRAVHTLLGHTVAIKILNFSGGESVLVQRFLNEARIQANLHHPGVAAFYEFIEFQGKPVIVMEYVDGQTIQEITAARGPWKIEDAVPIFCSCATTLEYIHAQGIVHRDLKSANLKINSKGELKLLDFGIATHQMVARLTTAGFVIGSFQSISPEQARGEQAVPASDIWSFGVLAYEMLTSTLPFEGSTQMELFSKIMRATYTPPTVLKPGIPTEMEHIIARCLRRKPQDRYPSMLAVKRDLERIPLAAGPGSGWRLALPAAGALASLLDGLLPSRRLKWSAAGVAAALLILAAVLLFLPKPPPHAAHGNLPPPSPPPATSTAESRQVMVDVVEGSAEVWEGNKLLGQTPFALTRGLGTSVTLTLRQPGFSDLPVQFDIGERAEFVFTMQRSAPQP